MPAHWFFLLLAIVAEVAGTTFMKLSGGLSRLLPSLAMLGCYAISVGALALAVKRFEIGVAYAAWSGIGTALIAVIGVVFFREEVNALKIASLALVIAGVAGLNLGRG